MIGMQAAIGLRADAEFDGRITSVPYDKSVKVDTWWDLGISDNMVIWFVQLVGKEIRVIDYYEAAGFGLDHYAGVLTDRGYLYGKHLGPHDIMHREIGTGKSRIETASKLGIEFEVAPNIPVKDGIDAVRMTMNRMWFDKRKTSTGLDALKLSVRGVASVVTVDPAVSAWRPPARPTAPP